MNELEQLKAQVQELLNWKRERETQQITQPLDPSSRNILDVPYSEGLGGTELTQSISLSGEAQSITVPRAYVDTFILVVSGVRYEIPVVAIS